AMGPLRDRIEPAEGVAHIDEARHRQRRRCVAEDALIFQEVIVGRAEPDHVLATTAPEAERLGPLAVANWLQILDVTEEARDALQIQFVRHRSPAHAFLQNRQRKERRYRPVRRVEDLAYPQLGSNTGQYV